MLLRGKDAPNTLLDLTILFDVTSFHEEFKLIKQVKLN